jgi:stress-induced morphogen
MLKLMKDKAKQLKQEKNSSNNNINNNSVREGSIYQSINIKLQMLKPLELVIEDESYKHAGHAGVKDIGSSETHFNIKIVATCFEGLSLVQRHRMIYTLLGPEMNQSIHALSIVAKTPSEV